MASVISIKQVIEKMIPHLEQRMMLINKKQLTEEEKQVLNSLEEQLFKAL